MQLALTADVLLPLGAGVVVVALVALIVVLRRARRARPDTPEPTASDWTGEAATGDPAPQPGPVTPSAVAPPTTVGDAVAVRESGTAPPPVGPAELVAGSDHPDRQPDTAPPVVAAPATATATAPPTVTAPDPGDRTGSSRSVAAAVAKALAVRAAAENAPRAATPGPGGDVRDRLLAVLLADPACAVGATVELEACCSELDRLAEAVRHQRSALGEVMGRLAGAGLLPEQLARLSGLPIDEVHELLAGAGTRV